MNYKTLAWLVVAAIAAALLTVTGTATPASTSFPSQSFKLVQATIGGTTVSASQLQSVNKNGLTVDLAGIVWDTSKTPYNNSILDANLNPCASTPPATMRGINDGGDIVGSSSAATGYFCDATAKTVTTINPPGGLLSIAYAINNSKTIVGAVQGGSPDPTVTMRGFIYKNKSYTTISYPDTTAFHVYSTTAEAINDSGIVVGVYSARLNDANSSTAFKLFQYSNGTYTTLPDRTGFVPVYATGINENGWIVANFLPDPKTTSTNTTQVSSAVLVNGKWQQIAYPGAGQTYVRGINNKGQLSGFFISSATGMASPTGFITNPVQVDAMVFDATNIASGANEGDGVLYDASKSPITEAAVAAHAAASQAKGLVADGNARLVIRVRSNAPGTITVTVNSGPTSEEPSNTGTSAKVYPLLASGTVTEGKASLTTTDLATSEESKYQASFTLVAGYDYSGPEESENSPFSVDICLKKTGSTECDASQRINLAEKRTPVILIHGLWADRSSFVGAPSGVDFEGAVTSEGPGLANSLLEKKFDVGFYEYDNAEGPTNTMSQSQSGLASKIEEQCRTNRLNGYACTRANIVGHSMGGLVVRKYITNNLYYKTKWNFQIGSVSKVILAGTPNYGSEFASIFMGGKLSCVDKEKVNKRLQPKLEEDGKRISTAVSDITPKSDLLSAINSVQQKVKFAALVGDLGTNKVITDYWFPFKETAIEWYTGCTSQEIFTGSNTDGVVKINSQRATISHSMVLGGVPHSGMGKNKQVIDSVLKILSGKTSDYFDEAMYATAD